MPVFTVTTSKGTFDVEANRQPTPEEAEQLVAGEQGKQDLMRQAAQAEDKSLLTQARGTLLEVGGGLVGGVGGFLVGGPVGAALGAGTGSGIGNWIDQKLQERETGREVKPGQVAGAVIGAAIPGGVATRAVMKSSGFLRPMLIRATEGGVAAATATTVEKAIDEGRLPTFYDEVLPSAAMGATFGGVAGGVERRYAQAGRFITNNAAAQAAQVATGGAVSMYVYNREKERGNENALTSAAAAGIAAYGATHIPSLLMRIEGDALKRAVSPEGVVGPEVSTQARERVNTLKAYEDDAVRLATLTKREADAWNKLNQPAGVMAQSSGGPALPANLVTDADILSVMNGQASETILPSPVRTYVREFRKKRSEYSKYILDNYDNLSQDIRDTIDNDSESYLRRAYAAHDPNAKRGVDFDVDADRVAYHKELTQSILNTARAKVKAGTGTPMNQADAEQKASAIMHRMMDDVYYSASGKVGVDTGTSIGSPLMHRHEISKLGRKWLGEVKDPFMVMKSTLSAQSRLVVHSKYDEQMANFLLQSGIGTTAPQSQGGLVKMTAGDKPLIGDKLANIYVPEQFAKALGEVMSPNLFGDGRFMANFMKAATFSKAMKTVGNIPEALPTQAMGNLLLAATSGKVSINNLALGVKMAMRDLGWTGGNPMSNVAIMRELKELRSLGVLRGGVDSEELRTFMSMAAREKTPSTVLDKFSKIYGFADVAARYAIYRGNLKEAQQMYGSMGMSLDAMKKMAARQTADDFVTQEKVPRRLRQMSALSLANNFGAFEFEVARTAVKQVRYAVNLLNEGRKTNNQAMMAIGMKRMASMASVAAGTAAAVSLLNRAQGITEDEERDLAKAVPNYDRNKANVFFWKDRENGKFAYFPMNYVMPYANMSNVLAQAYQGNNPLPYAKSIIFGDDLGPLATPAIEMITNKYYGTSSEISPTNDRVALFERFASRAFLPQFLAGTLARAEKASRDVVSPMGTVFTMEDVGMRLGGVRATTLQYDRAMLPAFKDALDPITGELQGYRRIIRDRINRETGGYEGVNEALLYRESSNRYATAQRQLRDLYLSAVRQSGKNGDAKAIAMMEEAGVPSRLITAAAIGYTEPMPRGIDESDSEIIDRLKEKYKGDPMRMSKMQKELFQMAGDNIVRRKGLNEAMRSGLREDLRNKAPLSDIFAKLPVQSGERARAIMQATEALRQQGGEEAAAKFVQRLRQDAVLTPEVQYQIRNGFTSR